MLYKVAGNKGLGMISKYPPTTLKLKLQPESWILVLSDTHLMHKVTEASDWLEREITTRIETKKDMPGIVILNGDIIELWAGKNPTVSAALQSHPRLTKALKSFADRPNCHVVYIVGNHDAKIGWDKQSQKSLIDNIHAKICFQLQLQITGSNKTLLFEHGHRFDKDNAITDPRDPNDTPLGQHIVQEALPLVKESQGKLLTGLDHLAEPHNFPKFVASRLFYREILSRSWWLLIPVFIGLAGRLLLEIGIFQREGYSIGNFSQIILITEAAIFLNVVIVLIILFIIIQKILARAKGLPGQGVGIHHNDQAREFISANKDKNIIGFATGHTHRPEVTELKHGFYANSGSATEMVEAMRARFGLPKTYISRNQLSWLEITIIKNSITTSLYKGTKNLGKQSRLESILTKKRKTEIPLGLQKQITLNIR